MKSLIKDLKNNNYQDEVIVDIAFSNELNFNNADKDSGQIVYTREEISRMVKENE